MPGAGAELLRGDGNGGVNGQVGTGLAVGEAGEHLLPFGPGEVAGGALAGLLDQVVETMNLAPTNKFFIDGHTDSKGTYAYNSKLSSDRALAVAEALKKDYGIASDRLEPHGVGPLVPVFANGSDAGRDRNRRVELVER